MDHEPELSHLPDGSVSLALDRFELGEKIALAYAIAFLHRKAHDTTHHVRTDVDVFLRFDFSVSRYRLSEILANHASSLHCNDSSIPRKYAIANRRGDRDGYNKSDQDLFLCRHWTSIRTRTGVSFKKNVK